MIVSDLADLVGARGPRVRWGRAWLFALAWLLGDVVYQIVLLPLGFGGWSGTRSWVLLSVTLALQFAADLVLAVFITLLAVLLLRRIPDVFVVTVALALVHAPLARGLFAATLVLRAAGAVHLASPLWDPLSLGLSALGTACFFGGLALALRFIPRLVSALLAGAVGGQLVAMLMHLAVLVALGRLADVSVTLRFLPLSLVRALVFALLLGGALLSLSPRPTEVPDGPPPEGA